MSATMAAAPPLPTSAGGFWSRIDPRYLQAGLATTILVVGQWQFGTIGGYDRLLTALLCALGCETIFSLWIRKRWPAWPSVYISGLSVVILTKPNPSSLAWPLSLWPFALTALISITSKYVITYRGRHLFNPTNFGLCMLLLLASNQVALLSTQWGNAWGALALIWAWGTLVVVRAKVFTITLTYLLSFSALAWVRTLVNGNSYINEVAPITGPMLTLFMFFMVTDPAVVPTRQGARIAMTVAVALLECLFRLQNEWRLPGMDWVLMAPPMFAYFLIGPVARWLDLRFVPQPLPGARPAPAASSAIPLPA